MSKQSHIIASRHTSGHQASIRTYTLGFILSVTLTLIAFTLVYTSINNEHGGLSSGYLIASIFGLAIAQLIVQLQFFIHLGHESKPRWSKLAFLFMLLVVFIVGGGSLWIMDNLHYNMMNPIETDTYMKDSEGVL